MNQKIFTLILFIILVLLSIVSLFIGAININFIDIIKGNSEHIDIWFLSRFPRLLAIICTGVGMSIAGIIMQQLCMNKFVSPSTSSTISSAQLGILLAMVFFPKATLTEKLSFSFVTSIIGTYIFIFFMQNIKYKDIIMVPLVGIMFGNIIGGITSFISYRYDLIQAMNSFIVGDFSLIIKGNYEIVFLIIPLVVIAYIFSNHFNIVGMGEDFSKNLGVNYNIILVGGLSISALITASVVVTVGTIPYIGLIIPNIVSIFKGDKLKENIIDTALVGAIFVLLCDIIGRLIIFPYEIPVNLIVGVLGSILFICLLYYKIKPSKIDKKVSSENIVDKSFKSKGGYCCEK